MGQAIESTLEIKSDLDSRNATFIIGDEDHTLGNALRYTITTNRDVELVGYSVPHPSNRSINLRIQTKQNAEINAIQALQQGLDDLSSIREHIKQQFQNEVESMMED